MKILFISRNSPFESMGGIERYIRNLMQYYSEHKTTELHILLPTNKDDYSTADGNVTLHYSKSLFLSRDNLATNKEISKNAKIFSLVVSHLIDTENIDIICAENFHTDLPAAYSLLLHMVTNMKNIPLVLQLHSFATTQLQTELINQLPWDNVSCISTSVAGDCFQKGADIASLTTHYLGVNTKEFTADAETQSSLKEQLGIDERNTIILTATRIIRGKINILQQKGVINLLQAFSKLAPRYPDLTLLIAIGKPPESLLTDFHIAYEMLQGYIKLHNIENQTILHTFKLDEMPDVYRGSDVFVLPSENETFGQVFIEAMSCGLPVIGTKVGGIPEIISDSYNGYLVPAEDASILAQRIEKLTTDKDIRSDFIKAGQKTITEKFTADQQFANFHHILEKIVDTKSVK